LIAVRQLKIAPSEFWGMRPRHFWLLLETEKPQEGAKKGLNKKDASRLLKWAKERAKNGNSKA